AVIHKGGDQRATDRASYDKIAHLLDGPERDDECATGRAIEEHIERLNTHEAQHAAEQLPDHDGRRRDDAPARATYGVWLGWSRCQRGGDGCLVVGDVRG